MNEYNDKLEVIIKNYKNELAQKGKTVIKFKIISKANRTEFLGLMDDNTIKLAVDEVAQKGKANNVIYSFLSKEFGVGKQNIKIISGQSSKLKLISIQKED
ncbi:MAG: DUF167 domain-containing protein [Eubacteriaceae bacterium]|nr:DUF167 domain-containing protein [Eubacteriaceae bacterium]